MKKILAVLLSMLMIVSCVPVVSAVQVGSYGFTTNSFDTTSFESLLEKDNLAHLTEEILETVVASCSQEEFCDFLYDYYPEFTAYYDDGEYSSLADGLVAYVDFILNEADLNSEIKDVASLLRAILGVSKIDLNSVDGVLETAVGVFDFFKSKGTSFGGDLSTINYLDLTKGSGKIKQPITSLNSTAEEIVEAVKNFVVNNNSIIKKIIKGQIDFGNINSTIKTVAGLDLEEECNGYFLNLKENGKVDIYSTYLKGETEITYEESIYKNFTVDELLATALYKICTGNNVSSVDELAVPASVYYEVIKNIDTFSQQYKFNIGMFSIGKLPEFILSMLCNEATVRTEITADESLFDGVMCNEINKIFDLICSAVHVEPERVNLTGSSLVEDFILLTADVFDHGKISEHIHTEEIILGFAATCSVPGLTDGIRCSVCYEIIVVQTEIPTTEHEYDSWLVLSEVTCSQDGIKVCSCNNCSEIKVDNEKAYGHIDADADGKCDDCSCLLDINAEGNDTSVFSAFIELLNRILNFFRNLLGIKT